MDKLKKALLKLSPKERKRVDLILKKLEDENMRGLDIKKLMGGDGIYRARSGDIRIIYRKTSSGTKIITIERRGDNTYKKF